MSFAQPSGTDLQIRASSAVRDGAGPCDSPCRWIMSLAKSVVLAEKALKGSSGLAFDLLGRTYCHCAVPTGEHSRTIDIMTNQVNSEASEESCNLVQASLSE